MKTIFDANTRNELIARIGSLNETNTAQWGKMNVYQMAKHCRLWEEMIAGQLISKRVFIGRIFGKMALKSFLNDDNPIRRNSPTTPELQIKDTHADLAAEKAKWIALIERYANYFNPGFVHPFFGRMTDEQIGRMAYKHTDHHLRQFNA
ncbi:DUF1569 domain-containing protein [Mucilaginibacter sp.]|uniref:DUF1569 domain-containing protein n=1 Tax=Mucilaginibacter sp. TaxID=1882438 RepID=UPI0035BC25E1